ncbi:hypothetical protein C8Q78DRAFT_206363 [Trametes maxima]|nr:hypothetical protein C8Q78DRAFT_206363 [Trametes maxima]
MATPAFHRLPCAVHEEICRQILYGPRADDEKNHIGRDRDRRRWPTVAGLARTCRFFHEPALNALWHSIPDIACLLFTLPRKTYSRKNPVVPNGGGVYMSDTLFELTGEIIQQHELDRLLVYARRVRTVGSKGEHLSIFISCFAASSEVYRAFSELLGDRPLLPNVYAVNFKTSPARLPRVFPYLHVLFGPQLRRFSVRASLNVKPDTAEVLPSMGPDKMEDTLPDEEAIYGMLMKLCDKCPQLQQLDLFWSPSSLLIARGTLFVLLNLRHLTSVSVPRMNTRLTVDVFVHLALLPSITSLTCHFGDTLFTEADYNMIRTKGRSTLFPALQQLRLGAKSFVMINELLGCIDFPYLTLLSVSALAAAPHCDMVALLQNVGTFCKRIHTLYIGCPYIFDGPSGSKQPTGCLKAPAPIDEPTLEPLLALPGMRDLVLYIHCPYYIDDNLLIRIARTWPQLTRIKFGSRVSWGGLPPDTRVGSDELALDPTASIADLGLPEDWARSDNWSFSTMLKVMGKVSSSNPLRAWSWSPPPATLIGVLALLHNCPDLTDLGQR